ncbi:MAG: hypothetical protein PHR11_04350 [Candidatus Omnitrophica bacterium]|nr:hypothetical protein [Candidatus Omnitrophota bacterium]
MRKALTAWIKNQSFPILFCGCVAAALYYPVFLGYWAVNGSDALNLHLPLNSLAARSFLQGSLPYWNSLFNLGQPVIDGTTTVFHPALILYAFFDAARAHTIEVIAGLFLALLGAWTFLRSLGMRKFSASAGTACYALCGPVFFLHSYHLGFLGITLLPWCLFFAHRYDRTLKARWLWLAGACLVLAAQACDADTALYLYAGVALDRLACLPVRGKKSYCIVWLPVIFLAALTGLAAYVPLYEWLSQSSRALKNSVGILTPSFANLFTAIFTNRWLHELPYDVFYFYFGPAFLWLALSAKPDLKDSSYPSRYFLCAASIPLLYLVFRLLQCRSSSALASLDVWRSMFVFCLSLAVFAAQGIERIGRWGIFELRLTLAAAVFTAIIAALCFFRGFPRVTAAMLACAAAGMGMACAGWLKTPLLIRRVGIALALVSTVVFAAFARVTVTPSCAWNSSVINLTVQPPYLQCPDFMQNLAYYRRLAPGNGAHTGGGWRVSLWGGTDNTTALAGLKTLPNYTSVYNMNFEKSLRADGLIKEESGHPYWMTLEKPDARALSVYGVRFLVLLGEDTARRPGAGWVLRNDLSWPSHRVWENIHYLGRAYLVSASGRRRGGVEFLKDGQACLMLKVSVQEGERLVLADLDYPGWDVLVDARPSAGQRYHGCLRSIELPPGSHVVTWLYRGGTQKKALWSAGLAIFALLGYLCFLTFPSSNPLKHSKGPLL